MFKWSTSTCKPQQSARDGLDKLQIHIKRDSLKSCYADKITSQRVIAHSYLISSGVLGIAHPQSIAHDKYSLVQTEFILSTNLVVPPQNCIWVTCLFQGNCERPPSSCQLQFVV